MVSIALIGLCAFGLILVLALIGSFHALDRLIEHEYHSYRDAWERDGRPNGMLFRPPEATYFGSSFAFHRCALVWPFSSPPWARDDARAKLLLTRLRWLLLIWNGGLLLFVIFFCLYLHSHQTI
jgi:hypothetical protein